MRKAVYAALKNAGFEVYHIGNINKKKKPPYLLLEFGSMIKTRTFGNRRSFSVTVFAPAGDMEMLDTLCETVIKTLDKKHLNRISDANTGKEGSAFFIEFAGCASEFMADEWDAVTKQIDFHVPLFGNDFM